MIVAWVWLGLAIATEIVGTLQLRTLANGWHVLPAVIVVVSYSASFLLMIPALRTLNVGVSYAIWSGVGTGAIATIGAIWFGDRLNAVAVVGLVLIVAGVVAVTLSGGTSHG
ncbi:small multidrug resistance pump [Nakamurella sp. UYEF19]|uniref:DMT family transporter n=1 Tax=Nakamurella sp. UYEF19 TaxID=1756392 RepID=UPI003396A865